MDNKTLFAAKLNGRQKNEEISSVDNAALSTLGLVVVFGWSDDLVEFRGKIYDEFGAWRGAALMLFNDDGKVRCTNDRLSLVYNNVFLHQIDAIWCPTKDGESKPFASWLIDCESLETASFDIYDGKNLFCRGIVFDYNDLLNPHKKS